jgi:hypothetical protein
VTDADQLSAIASIIALAVFFLFLKSNWALIQVMRIAILAIGPILSLYSLGDWFHRSRMQLPRIPLLPSSVAIRMVSFFLWGYVAFAYIYRIFINPPSAP